MLYHTYRFKTNVNGAAEPLNIDPEQEAKIDSVTKNAKNSINLDDVNLFDEFQKQSEID